MIFKEKPKLCLVKYLDFNLIKDHINKKIIIRFVFTWNRRFINYSLKK